MRTEEVLPIRRTCLTGTQLADVVSWTASVEAWPAGSHVWGHYAEQTEAGPAICRTENVSSCHAGFRSLVRGPLREVASSYLGGEAADFKDKINYKQPGGAGFSPHQDLLAYPGASKVVSVLVAVDECSTASGCLWMDPGVDELLPVDERGVVTEAASVSLAWTPAELAPGDAVCIGGLVPHFSEANRSRAKRRVLVASYAPRDEGYTRSRYYERRCRIMDAATSAPAGSSEAAATLHAATSGPIATGGSARAVDRVRISALADFEGTPVQGSPSQSPSGGTLSAVCTHG